MSDDLKRLTEWVNQALATTSRQFVLESVTTIIAQARADALEEAVEAVRACEGRMHPWSAALYAVEALRSESPPASIPIAKMRDGAGPLQADDPPGRSVERVQHVLWRALAERPGHPVRRAVEAIAGDLGVPLDDGAKASMCEQNGLRPHVYGYGPEGWHRRCLLCDRETP